jgi:hypothetical protein
MTKRKPAGEVATRKKSVSKAPAAAGREDSRAVQIKRDKEARSRKAHEHPAELAGMYKEREHDADRERKVHRREKHKH